jgi:ribosomal protein L31
MKIKRNCKNCNIEFETYQSRIDIGRGNFCSRDCFDYWQKNYRQEICFYLCKDCGEAIQVRSDHLKDRNLEYCKSCNMDHYKADVRMEKHPNWQGGKSFEEYPIEFSKVLRKYIRERDNHICQECNFTEEQLGYKLSVHHIDFNKKNNNPNNLISLCKSCHAQTNFNREDWEKYFKER